MTRKLRTILLAATALGMGQAAPAWAQGAEDDALSNDIIVTAQRIEQRLQDVPVSISVFSQQELSNNAVFNSRDLAAITPGLQVQSRYGEDATNFSIRGFTQEQRTYATVGVYFADVVAPRGSGATFGGDGGGPGSLFDLQNVQVLKGPQGTLFGRNTSGGAVLLVPQKPTSRLEGYVEGQLGDYDMRGLEAVINLPLADTFRARIGGVWKERDGYLKNIGNVGDGKHGNKGMGNVDYFAVRASMVGDLTPTLENYTVFSYSKSQNNGTIPKIIESFPGVLQFLTANPAQAVPFGTMAFQQMQREAAHGPWTVSNRLPNSHSDQEQWQVVNTLTWTASDSITVKNILAYGEFTNSIVQDLFGTYFIPVNANPDLITSAAQVTGFAFTASEPFSGKTNAQSSFVGELRIQGTPVDSPLTWQAGIYTEISNPLGWSGVQTATIAACNDISTLNCVGFTPAFSSGSIGFQRNKSRFRNYAAYGQASYDLSEQFKLTAGLRYTWDKQSSVIANIRPTTAGTATCLNARAPDFGKTFPASERAGFCLQDLKKNTSAPTWLVGMEFRPADDVMLYGKYTRGYRAGGLSLFSPDPTQEFNEERIDVFEAGAKASWRGAVPGSINLSGYYNKFKDQQLLLGITSSTGAASPNASIVNAGKSRMWGIDADVTVRPFEGFRLMVAYAYLNTKLQAFVPIPIPAPYDIITPPAIGGPIPNSQPHKLSVAASYTLPLSEDIGRITIGGNYVYTARYRSVADSPNGVVVVPDAVTGTPAGTVYSALGRGIIPGSHIVNLNVNWEDVGGLPVDATFFMTNVTNEVSYLTINAGTNRGFNGALLAPPRMWGVRLKYKFGN
jgi:iron complex outermembrane recepter protein